MCKSSVNTTDRHSLLHTRSGLTHTTCRCLFHTRAKNRNRTLTILPNDVAFEHIKSLPQDLLRLINNCLVDLFHRTVSFCTNTCNLHIEYILIVKVHMLLLTHLNFGKTVLTIKHPLFNVRTLNNTL